MDLIVLGFNTTSLYLQQSNTSATVNISCEYCEVLQFIQSRLNNTCSCTYTFGFQRAIRSSSSVLDVYESKKIYKRNTRKNCQRKISDEITIKVNWQNKKHYKRNYEQTLKTHQRKMYETEWCVKAKVIFSWKSLTLFWMKRKSS